MRALRTVLLAAGLGLVALGAALAVAPDLLAVGGTQSVVAAVALAAVVGLAALHGRVALPRRAPAPPAPEGRADWAVPGEALDRRLAGVGVAGAGDDSDREAVADHVESLAVAVLAHHRGLDEVTARRRLADGDWTADPTAAAFLADDPPAPTLRDRLRTLRTGEPTARRRAERAIAAIARIAEADGSDDDAERAARRD